MAATAVGAHARLPSLPAAFLSVCGLSPLLRSHLPLLLIPLAPLHLFISLYLLSHRVGKLFVVPISQTDTLWLRKVKSEWGPDGSQSSLPCSPPSTGAASNLPRGPLSFPGIPTDPSPAPQLPPHQPSDVRSVLPPNAAGHLTRPANKSIKL